MKISIGINTYKPFERLENRQKLCIESLQRVKNKFSNINLYNIQYSDENNFFEDFTSLNVLNRKPYDILIEYFDHHGLIELYEQRFKPNIDSIKTSRIPSVYDLFDALANTECDYFLFLNDDIILSDRFIKQLESNPGYDCYPASRIHAYNLESLDKPFTPESYSVHGFDAFCISKTWWLDNRYNFPHYILGKPYWDTHYFTLCQLLGETYTLNKLPPVLFHPEHQSTSCTNLDLLAQYNEDIFNRDLISKQLWFNYVYSVLLKRPTVNNIKWYQPFQEEQQLEQKLFKDVLTKTKPFKTVKPFKPEQLTSEETFDAFIACAPKDAIKLPFTLTNLIKNAKGLNKIHVCTPKPIGPIDINFPIVYHLDKNVLPSVDPMKWKFRPNWIFQQFLKLFQNVTTTEYYLTLDVDTILSNKFTFFENNHPIWNVGWRQNHLPYFLFNKYILNLNKNTNHTFICDMNFFNKKIINQMLDIYGITLDAFVNKSYELITSGCHIAEPEIYGNFIEKYYPGLYTYKYPKQYVHGKDHSSDPNAVPWTLKEIQDIIEKYSTQGYDMVQIHSWCASFENHWE